MLDFEKDFGVLGWPSAIFTMPSMGEGEEPPPGPEAGYRGRFALRPRRSAASIPPKR